MTEAYTVPKKRLSPPTVLGGSHETKILEGLGLWPLKFSGTLGAAKGRRAISLAAVTKYTIGST